MQENIIPITSISSKALIIVEIIFIRLRLSLFLAQIMDRHSPMMTQAILTPPQTVRNPSGNTICRNTGISVRCVGFSIDFNDGVDEKQLSVVLRVLKYAD